MYCNFHEIFQFCRIGTLLANSGLDEYDCDGTSITMNRIPRNERLEIFSRCCQFREVTGEEFTICSAHRKALGHDFEENNTKDKKRCLWKSHTGSRRLNARDETRPSSLHISQTLYEHDGTILPPDALLCLTCYFKVRKVLRKANE